MPSADLRQWHRLFGIALTDLFSDTPWRVELEKELALQSQLLDVAIIVRTPEAPLSEAGTLELPDGLETLRAHNLLTFKSQHEALTAWTLEELVGHYVNYRKLTGPPGRLPAEADFGLYAAAVRFPRELARQVSLRPTPAPGVFDIPWGARHIRLVVLSDIARHPRNAPWELFSASTERLRAGARDYRVRRASALELLTRLYLAHELEGSAMPYTMEEFIRETRQEILNRLTPEERQDFLAKIPAEERLNGLTPAEVLKQFSPEERLSGLTPEELRQLKDHLNALN